MSPSITESAVTVPARRGAASVHPAPRESVDVVGPYRLGELLGSGGMGAVYRAQRLSGGPEVAVKVLGSHMRVGTDGWARFAREIAALDALSHPSVVRLLEQGVDGDRPWFAMELVEGPNLAKRIERGGPMSIPEALAYVRQLASALAAAHAAGLVHRDVKPSNVVIAPGRAKLLDFGLVLSVERGPDRLTAEDVLLGTPGYLAPEGVSSPWALSARSDVYQLAELAIFVRSGVHPYRPADVIDREAHAEATERAFARLAAAGGYPAGVVAALRRALAYDPADRPASAAELLEAIERPALLGS